MKLIERPQYLNFLIRNKDLPLIKVITGVRRSGKSTLFTLYKNYLTSSGVPEERIIDINFEDLAFEDLQEYHVLYRYILERSDPVGKTTFFWMKSSMCHNLKKPSTVSSSKTTLTSTSPAQMPIFSPAISPHSWPDAM